MKNNRQSIAFTVIAGYLALAVLAGMAVYFAYSKVLEYTSRAERESLGNKKLYLVSDAATKLYKAESLSRQLIQSENAEKLEIYEAEIDTVKDLLDSLRQTYSDPILKTEIDSMNSLLDQKRENLAEILKLRSQQGNQSYYAKVIAELKRVDENFENYNYDQRFENLEPYQKRVLVKLLEYSKRDNAENVTNQTVDSLVNSVKTVLIDFEKADRTFRQALRSKENELLANEASLNSQLRSLLSKIEEQERRASLEQVTQAQQILDNTSQTIALFGALTLLVFLGFLFLIIRDVSRSQRYRRELENAKQYAESLLKSREQFMATVTHDLRSPLNTVMGYTNLLEKSTLSNSQNLYLKQVKNSTDFILRLVNDLLDLSRLEAGKMFVEKLSFNPKQLIEGTIENTFPVEKKNTIKVEMNISPDLDRPLISDPFRIKQILANLLSNAFKFTENGIITVTANLESEKKNYFLLVAVKDSGIGISEERKEKIFEEFSQENSTIEKRFGGSGLGLAISKRLTHLLKGSISLNSEVGKGSEFRIKVPVMLAPSLTEELPEKNDISSKQPEDFQILIVDDEESQLSLLSELMRSSGMRFQICQNGKEALEILKNGKFDLVLTDIQMPVMNGIEFITEAKKNEKIASIPFIALSGQSNISDDEYRKMAFSGNLLKPYSAEDLLKRIQEILKIDLRRNSPELPDVENAKKGFSLEEIRRFSGDDRLALNTILSAFLNSSKKNLSELKMASKKGQTEVLSSIAHKMLPMFRQIKAEKVVRQLAILEEKDKFSSVNLEELEKDINEILQEIQEQLTS
ncbi:MAG TPA: ATP-binding protein [Salinimicrobium sp.]|nr:ATP-binding protein [Salinimicrobium sp.]